MSSNALNQIISQRHRNQPGCILCGAKSDAAIQMKITLIDKSRGFQDHTGPSRTLQKTFCADHAVEMWEMWKHIEEKENRA